MISKPRPKIDDEIENLDQDTLVNNTGWIYDFFITQQSCNPVHGMKVSQYEIRIVERVNERKFKKIIFQLGGKTYGDIEAVAQGLFYSLTTMLSYDIDDYTLDEVIHIKGIRDFIEKTLVESKKDVNAYSLDTFSIPIVYEEPKFEPRQYYQI